MRCLDSALCYCKSNTVRSDNPVLDKSYRFAVDIVRFCRVLQEQKREYILSKQLLRSGTSVGANIEEAQQPQSRADFLSKMSIALKEAYESRYWLRLMCDTNIATSDQLRPFFQQLEEIISLLVRITYSTKHPSCSS